METINLKAPQLGMSGEYRAVLRNEDESVIYDSGWHDNLITTRGLYLYGDSDGAGQNWQSNMYIGSSGAPVDISDTAMGAFLASSTTITATDGPTNAGNPDYEHIQTNTYRFDATQGATVTVRECGMGTNAASNYLFSHHLLDTPIVKTGQNILDISYRFTIWPSLIETTASAVPIDGVNYTCKTSWYNLNGTLGTTFVEYVATNNGRTWDGDKAGQLDTDPSGDSAAGGTSGSDTFAIGSQRMYSIYGLTGGNTPLDVVRTATNRTSNWWYIQTEFNAEDGPAPNTGIPKDGTKELTLIWTLTYGERP